MSIFVATLTRSSDYEGVMADEDEILEVIVPVEDYEVTKTNILKQIWNQITAGVGVWGTFRPIIAITLSLIPFLYLGQHFNRKHQRGSDYFFLQIPLSFTLILWVILYFWSIFDAWRDASVIVARSGN